MAVSTYTTTEGVGGQNPGDQDAADTITPAFDIPEYVENLGSIPPALHASYEKQGDRYVYRNAAQLKKALQSERENAKASSAKLSQLQATLHELGIEDINPDNLKDSLMQTISAHLQKQAPTTPPKDEASKAAIQEALEQAAKEHSRKMAKVSTDLADAQRQYSTLLNDYKQKLVNWNIQTAVSAVSLTPDGKTALPILLEKEVIVVEDGAGGYDVRVRPAPNSGEDLEFRINKQGEPMTLVEFVAGEMSGRFPSMFVDEAPSTGVPGGVIGTRKDSMGNMVVDGTKLTPNDYRKLRTQAKAGQSVLFK